MFVCDSPRGQLCVGHAWAGPDVRQRPEAVMRSRVGALIACGSPLVTRLLPAAIMSAREYRQPIPPFGGVITVLPLPASCASRRSGREVTFDAAAPG
jgi:hypothetical protein